MKKSYLIIGAGGFAAEVADMLDLLGHQVLGYYDEFPSGKPGYGSLAPPVFDTFEGIACDGAVIAIGDTAVRARLHAVVRRLFELPVFMHPSASVSPSANLAEGVVVMNNVVVTARARVETCALLNVGCYVAHDSTVGAYSHLAGGVQLGGNSTIGEGVMCGTNVAVLPDVSVGDWSTCGAGAVVTRDIPPRSLAVGVPARTIDSSRKSGNNEASLDE